jgi:transcriptional regulator with XRE-family HTH domain
MPDLGSALRLARASRSLREAARVLGVDVTTYRAWEAGFMRPQRQENFEALGTFLGLSKPEILGLLGYLTEEEVRTLVGNKRHRGTATAAATLSEDQGAYLSGPISVPILALVA